MNLGDQILPFNIEIKEENARYFAEIINGKERLKTLPFRIGSDSLYFRLPVFDSEFRAHISGPGSFSGSWYNFHRSGDYSIPFIAEAGISHRFEPCKSTPSDIAGKWEVTFSPGTNDEYKAVGLFEQANEKLYGTFMTETGDYRFLEGSVSGKNIHLSCFDGSHAFLFKATLNDSSGLQGVFYSGTHWSEPWVARKNNSFELTNPDSITYLKPGYESISFRFPNLEGQEVSYPSEPYNGKVTIVQVMGSWCPNCMDETVYLRDVYKQYHSKGLEIIALCFERSPNLEEAKKNVMNHKTHLGAAWEFLIAGKSSKDFATKALPMLNQVISFPTTIFIDKKGKIRKIHTGFYGPGTGSYYHRFQEKTQEFIEKLLSEQG
jgi:thiol-disulfide isomerase/thioredoxin